MPSIFEIEVWDKQFGSSVGEAGPWASCGEEMELQGWALSCLQADRP
jgi:hypothetical protein